MNAKRLHFILITLVASALLGSALTVWYASDWLAERSEDLVAAKLEGITLEEEQLRSFEAQNTLNEYSDLREIVKQVAPNEKEQEKIIAELYKIAAESNVTIQTLSFPSSDLGEQKAAPAAPATTQEGAGAAAAPAGSTPSNDITQTEKIKGLSGVVGLRIQPGDISEINPTTGAIREDGLSYDTILNFLEALERNRRQMTIDQISIVPILDNTSNVLGYTLTLSLTALIAI